MAAEVAEVTEQEPSLEAMIGMKSMWPRYGWEHSQHVLTVIYWGWFY